MIFLGFPNSVFHKSTQPDTEMDSNNNKIQQFYFGGLGVILEIFSLQSLKSLFK